MVGLVHPLMLSAELSSYGLEFGLEKGFEYCLFQIMFDLWISETLITPDKLDRASSKRVPIYFSCLWRLMRRRLAVKLQKMFCGPWNLTWLSAWVGNEWILIFIFWMNLSFNMLQSENKKDASSITWCCHIASHPPPSRRGSACDCIGFSPEGERWNKAKRGRLSHAAGGAGPEVGVCLSADARINRPTPSSASDADRGRRQHP